jgi:deoxyribonuclease-4
MLGWNVPTIGGLPRGFHWASAWGCECIQIYVTLSRRWAISALSSDDVVTFKAAWQKSPVKAVVAHVPYLVNLASPDKHLWQKSIERFSRELCRSQQFGVACVVFHPGSYVTSSKKEGMKRIVEAFDVLFSSTNDSTSTILLETMSGQGTMIGSRFEEIAQLLEEVNQPERLGVCFDTAHVFMAGYDLRGYDGYERVLQSRHASHRLSSSSVPPRAVGMM